MLRSAKGSPNGIQTFGYKKDETYDLPESLANSFFSTKDAEETSAPRARKPKVEKAMDGAPENTDAGQPSENVNMEKPDSEKTDAEKSDPNIFDEDRKQAEEKKVKEKEEKKKEKKVSDKQEEQKAKKVTKY